MFIPSVKSSISLIGLALVSMILFLWVENSREFRKQSFYEEKIEAAEWMSKAMQVIKDYRLQQQIFIDSMNDPNHTALIGEKNTLITTDRGSLIDKLTSTNPNMAAVIIDMFKEARLHKGDEIAVNVTGSMPAMNIAVLAAAKTMDLDVTLISSVGASMFGLTDPEFTWVDAETLLNESGIFSYKSAAASIGGGRDLGRGLNVAGRELIIEAIERNNVELVMENTLEENIRRKMEFFEENTANPKLYVNIGGGLSSLGSSIHGRLIPPGYHRFLSLKNIPLRGTMFLYAEKRVPVIHLLDIEKLAQDYDLPVAPTPLPAIGEGKMYVREHYNTAITIIALVILVLLIGIVIVFDHQVQKLRDDEVYKED